MNRCLHRSPLVCLALAASMALWLAPAALAQEQAPAVTGSIARTFPEAALRGQVAFTTGTVGTVYLNGNEIRTAPGFRLFSVHNTLIFQHAVQGQTFTVNYVIEPSTGLLHTVWILTRAEAVLARKGADAVRRNYGFASDSPTTK